MSASLIAIGESLHIGEGGKTLADSLLLCRQPKAIGETIPLGVTCKCSADVVSYADDNIIGERYGLGVTFSHTADRICQADGLRLELEPLNPAIRFNAAVQWGVLTVISPTHDIFEENEPREFEPLNQRKKGSIQRFNAATQNNNSPFGHFGHIEPLEPQTL